MGVFARGLAGKGRERYDEIEIHHRRINGDPGIVVVTDGDLYVVMVF